MDRILVFDRGAVVEEGRHEALVQRPGGLYRRLFERQALELTGG
jgi:ATP-binding cassette subfamily B protein